MSQLLEFHKNSLDIEDKYFTTEVGTPVTYPFQGENSGNNIDQLQQLMQYNMYRLVDSFSASMVQLVANIHSVRRNKGIADPVDVVTPLWMILKASDEMTSIISEILNLGDKLKLNSKTLYDFCYLQYETINQILDTVFKIPSLLNEYSRLVIDYVPTISHESLRYESIASMVHLLQYRGLIPANPRVLDIGCGDCSKTVKLADISTNIYAVDQFVTSTMVDQAARKAGIKFAHGDILSVTRNITSKSFGVVCLIGVIGHLTRDKVELIEAEIKRVLAAGGYLFLGPHPTTYPGLNMVCLQIDKNGEFVGINLGELLAQQGKIEIPH